MIRYAWRQFCDLSGDPMPDAPTSWLLGAVLVLLLRPVLMFCLVGPPGLTLAAWCVR